MIDGLCQRYGCLPSALLKEDAGLLRLVKTVALGQAEPPGRGAAEAEVEPSMEQMLAMQSRGLDV